MCWTVAWQFVDVLLYSCLQGRMPDMKLGSESNGRHADRSISVNCSCHHDESFKVIYFVNVRITCIYETNRGEYISLLNNSPVLTNHQCLDSRASLQILLYLCSVLTIEPLQFLIELHVTFVYVVYISIVVVHTSSAVLLSFCHPVDREM